MVRVVGQLEEVETEKEKAALQGLAERYWKIHHEHGKEQVKSELSEMVQPVPLEEPQYFHIEAFVVSSLGLASRLYPELFEAGATAVDKDGLTEYRVLTSRLQLLYPGVFLDPVKRLVLFAHGFFRRSLSRRNKLNEYFLQSFHDTAGEFPQLACKLRLDPDLIGHPSTITTLVEMEHWHGPPFSDDIASIRPGAGEYKASERARYFEGIDRTHFWWKAAEAREVEGAKVQYRTCEVEELIENAAGGLPGDRYGCRYAHAEFSPTASAITHFDGAIRAYPADAYLERIEQQIDRAGKHSGYTKLFRFDGPLPVARWKRLMSDYFRGNPLVPEYLGASGMERPAPAAQTEDAPDAGGNTATPGDLDLAALISLQRNILTQPLTLGAKFMMLPRAGRVQTVETGCEAVDGFLCTQLDLSQVTRISATDGLLNLARLGFGDPTHHAKLMETVLAGLAEALQRDIETLQLKRIALALSWPFGDLMTTLSVRGEASLVVQALERLMSVVDPAKAPSSWIEPLSVLVRNLAPRRSSENDFWNVTEGALECARAEETTCRLLLSQDISARMAGATEM
jgi:hypothetical protein